MYEVSKELAAMNAAKEKELRDALKDLLRAYEMLMPGIAHIAVSDYALINEAPIKARKALL